MKILIKTKKIHKGVLYTYYKVKSFYKDTKREAMYQRRKVWNHDYKISIAGAVDPVVFHDKNGFIMDVLDRQDFADSGGYFRIDSYSTTVSEIRKNNPLIVD